MPFKMGFLRTAALTLLLPQEITAVLIEERTQTAVDLHPTAALGVERAWTATAVCCGPPPLLAKQVKLQSTVRWEEVKRINARRLLTYRAPVADV